MSVIPGGSPGGSLGLLVLLALLALTAVCAALNWYAVSAPGVGRPTGTRRRLELLAKPATMLALIGVALSLGATSTTPGRWLLAALLLCLLGDVALLGDRSTAFVAGLAFFLLGQALYVVAFTRLGLTSATGAALGALVLLASLVIGRRILPSVWRTEGPALTGAVAAYMLVIGAMAVTGAATGRPLIGLGAALFVASDTILAVDRFVAPLTRGRLAVMVTYHLAQSLIVLGALR